MKIDFFLRFSLVFYLLTFLVPFSLNGQVDIARWTFELFSGTNSSPAPSSGSGFASTIGSMSSNGTITGSTTGCAQASGTTAWQIDNANPGTLESSGVEFKSSTVGFENIQFTWDQRFSNASTRTVRLQYTTDGTTWISFSLTSSNFISGCSNRSALDNGKIDVGDPITTNAGNEWSRRTVDFSSILAANDNPNFGVRLLASHYDATNQFKQAQNFSNNVNTGTPGAWRFDNVAFRGTALVVNPTLPFENCNLLVYRVGNGSTTLDNAANQVSLLEVSSAGAIVQTINNFTGPTILTQSGSATSNGFFNTYNGFVGLPGHNEAIGTASVNSNNSKRTIISDNNLNYYPYNLPVTAPIPFNSDNFRSVVPTSVNTFYASGNGSSNNGGIWYFNGSTYVQLLAGNIRNIEIFNDTLYFSAASSAFGDLGVYKLSNGLPISGTNQPFEAVVTYVSSITTAGPYGFSISPDGCTLYIADAGSTGAGSYPGISKWVRSGAIYNYAYSFSTNALGIVVDYSSNNPVIYATTTQSQNNNLIKIIDSGPSSVTSIILSSGGNYIFKGIDFTPSSTVAISISQQPQSQTVCENEAVSISVSAISSASLTYQWYSNSIDSYCGATPILGANSATFSPSVSTNGTTFYFVKIHNGCQSIVLSNRVSVVVNAPVAPVFTAISPICPNTIFSLPTNSINSFSGTWSPALNTSQTTNYTFTPSANQCATTTSMTVIVQQAPRIIALSPP